MKPLPDAHHVARYCPPSMVDESGRPMTCAFAMRSDEGDLPVNWLECFDPRVEVAVNRVRDALLEQGALLRPNGRFALLDIGTVKAAVKRSLGRSLHINRLSRADDASSSAIVGHPDDGLMVATEIRALVRHNRVRRAV
ncbi:MAG: hypothetical protein OXH68_09200 [Gammaproteobacteria bacterium]|nr:hypothetical protein [Gammaproteobacteria bacterium]